MIAQIPVSRIRVGHRIIGTNGQLFADGYFDVVKVKTGLIGRDYPYLHLVDEKGDKHEHDCSLNREATTFLVLDKSGVSV